MGIICKTLLQTIFSIKLSLLFKQESEPGRVISFSRCCSLIPMLLRLGSTMLHNAALPSLSLQSQLARRSQGALKDALAQRKLIRFIKKQAKKRSNSKAISVDFVLVVMEKGGLTRQESIALINHIVGHTSKKKQMGPENS